MNKLFALVVAAGVCSAARADFTENFEAFTGAGWTFSNQSNPLGPGSWTIQPGAAHSGVNALYVAYNVGSDVSTLSAWAELPPQTLSNGDTFSFWTEAPFDNVFADRLQVRLSTNGASSDTGTSEFDVGDYTTLLLEINPTLDLGVYPRTWTQFTITISGLSGPTNGRLAFRYFVEDGGPSGDNSDEIFIDDLAYVQAAPPCYANCDSSSTPPVLNVADFTCFLQKYAAGDPYANCDASTVAPTLNVADFTCFLQKYATGCP